MSQGVTSRSIPEYDRVDAMQYAPLIWESYRNSLSMSGDLSMEDASQRATDDLFSLIRYNPYGVPNNKYCRNQRAIESWCQPVME